MASKLISENIKVDYLFHTGDVINSSDLYEKTASELECCKEFYSEANGNKEFNSSEFKAHASPEVKNEFKKKLRQLTTERFQKATELMKKFASHLNIALGNVVICCGNHDVYRPFWTNNVQAECIKTDDIPKYQVSEEMRERFEPFERFLDDLETANSRKRNMKNETITQFTLGNLNILLLNTNWQNPKDIKPGYYCVHCEQIRTAINNINNHNSNMLNIILAHKPIYEICETARLSYKRYIKTPFMAALQEFVGQNGIYLCGDKHTRSIVGSFFHDIPHYIGGEPLTIKNSSTGDFEVEYNLLEIVGSKLGMERKIHLRSEHGDEWECELRPQDTVVSELYQYSKNCLIQNVLEIMAMPKILHTWENVCQEVYGWKNERRIEWYKNLDKLYKSICKYRKYGWNEVLWDSEEGQKNIFVFICEQLKKHIEEHAKEKNAYNLLNIRGEYSSSKSTFLGLLYIYLLQEYSIGALNFIPAYYNLENDEVLKKIKSNGISYHDTAKQVFENFTENIQKIAAKEHQSICYIIDGLDEQDCWSYSSEDSIGRGLLDILSKYDSIYYIMAFSQHRLPCFKNTMPPRIYNDTSDIIYFNPIDVREHESEDTRFTSFVASFLELYNSSQQNSLYSKCRYSTTKEELSLVPYELSAVCGIIRNFRRLTINPGFMYDNCAYIIAKDEKNSKLKHEHQSVDEIYRYYIDRQYEMCLQKLGYGFIHYAPAMAFLFSYHGYTYEQFKRLPENNTLRDTPIIKPICENRDKIYDTFLFIKKHNDTREYLIALHYNRELRYYAEHPDKKIAENSILNEYIVRNIAVLIRKLWSDTNKFIIVCEKLLQRDELSNCTQSILIYCLAHLEMYAPFRHKLCDKMLKKAEKTLLEQQAENAVNQNEEWKIYGKDDVEKLQCFVNLSLKHTMQTFGLIDNSNLAKLFIHNQAFCKYNRQHQMLYYGDLSIRGENKRHLLKPDEDIVYKGFDFHNCFNYLYVKLSSDDRYRLREFDMYTMWDLICSRLEEPELKGAYQQEYTKESNDINTFFYRDREEIKKKTKRILEQASKIFDYDNYIQKTKVSVHANKVYFKLVHHVLEEIIKIRDKGEPIEHAEEIKKMVKGFHKKGNWKKLLEEDEDDDKKWECFIQICNEDSE